MAQAAACMSSSSKLETCTLLSKVGSAGLYYSNSGSKPARGAMQGARRIITSEGVKGLYQGLLPTLLRDVPEIAIQFALYEK